MAGSSGSIYQHCLMQTESASFISLSFPSRTIGPQSLENTSHTPTYSLQQPTKHAMNMNNGIQITRDIYRPFDRPAFERQPCKQQVILAGPDKRGNATPTMQWCGINNAFQRNSQLILPSTAHHTSFYSSNLPPTKAQFEFSSFPFKNSYTVNVTA